MRKPLTLLDSYSHDRSRKVKNRSANGFLAALLTLILCAGDATVAQQGQSRPVGALRVTGEVRVNESQVTGDWTLFAGDRVRTGVDGAAAISVSGRGTLLVEPRSVLRFPDHPQFLAEIEQGRVTLRSLADARGFAIRIGNYAAVPVAPAESVTEIERAPDGSATITCRAGAVGLIELEGPGSLFVNAGQTVSVLPDGTVQKPVAPAPTTGPAEAPPGTRRRGWLALVLVGAGAGGAVAALAGRGGERQPVSPSVP